MWSAHGTRMGLSSMGTGEMLGEFCVTAPRDLTGLSPVKLYLPRDGPLFLRPWHGTFLRTPSAHTQALAARLGGTAGQPLHAALGPSGTAWV